MPTNPLWVEHTEKAAWDTVQTLRSEIQRERARLEQFMQLQPLLPKLRAALDALADDHAIADRDPLSILEAVREKIRMARAPAAPATAPVPASPAIAPAPRPERNLSQPVRWFARMLEREQRARGGGEARPDPAERQRLIAELERHAAGLGALAPRQLFESAVQIGGLALRLARIARRSPDE